MGIVELLLLAVGLSMDAFAVSVCKGLAMPKVTFRSCAICGLWFGGFQALMPMVGYLLGSSFERYINAIAPWIAFALLALIGGNMIREALSKEEDSADARLDFKTMLLMAVATSIDALAVGITFACVPVQLIASTSACAPAQTLNSVAAFVPETFNSVAMLNTILAVLIIGVTTFGLSCLGVKIGNVFGTRYKSRSEFAGGVILVLIGLKILLEHLGVL